jgi:hypothetical protein
MPVTAQHDERRAQTRVYDLTRQLEIAVDGHVIETENWSIGGFRSYGLFRLNKKERFSGRISIPGTEFRIDFTGKIIRVEEDGARIATLVEIGLDDLLALQEAADG